MTLKYTIIYKTPTGETFNTQSGKGETATLIDHYPVIDKYAFLGWFDGINTYAPGAEYTTGEDKWWTTVQEYITLTAVYSETPTPEQTAAIRYKVNGETYALQEVTNHQLSGKVPITVRSELPEVPYYTFGGWYEGTTKRSPGDVLMVDYNGEITLTARLTRKTGWLRLKSEYGTGNHNIQYNQGETATLPGGSADGMVFKGWSTSEGGTAEYLEGDTILIDQSEIILYAIWNTDTEEQTVTLADGTTLALNSVTWYTREIRGVGIGSGDSTIHLSDVGYSGLQFVPEAIVQQYPQAFGLNASEMNSAKNPLLEYANVLKNGKLDIKFIEQDEGYVRDSIKLAVFSKTTLTGYVLIVYLAQETDSTNYTIILQKSNGATISTYPDLKGDYRHPYLFTFPEYEDGDAVVDTWTASDDSRTYNPGDSLTLTGRYLVPDQTLIYTAAMVGKPAVLKFALQGGRNGPGTMTSAAGSTASFTIPACNISRRGYLFRGWGTSANDAPTLVAGDSVTVSAGSVLVLYASWQAITSPFSVQGDLYLPYCGIRIWKNATAYFNATFYQVEGGLAVISKAENRPGSATFTLANDYGTPARSLCSPSFAQWSDGSTGEITTGMYVELLDIRSKDDASLSMDGRITTMTPNGDTVSFEVGDGITFLSKTGSWLRRNYREIGETQEHDIDGYIEDGALKVNIGQYKGTPSAVYRYKTEEVSIPLTRGEKQGINVSTTFRGTARKTVEGSTYTRIRKIRFKVRWDIVVEYGTAMVAPILKITTPYRTYDKTFHYSEIYDTKGSKEYEYSFGGYFTGDVSISINSNVSGQNYGDQYVEDCYIYADKSEVVTVTSQQYVDGSPDSYDLADPSARLHVVYEKGSVTIPSLMKMIAEAIGYGVDIPEDIPQKKLAIFRAGGSYAQTYLQKLADQSENGRAYSYYVEGASPTLRIGARYKLSDPPKYIAKYGGDTAPSGYDATVINIADFAPKKTLKNRPNLVTLKASLQEGHSITVCFENPSSTDARDGLTIEKIVTDSSASSIEGVGSAAYAELMSTDLDQWEGEMTLPGILWGMMSEGDPNHAGSGVPILIKDSRFGMDSFRTRVRQVTYDYDACTTKVILGNYDLQYSSGIANTNALAVEVSDMVGGISDTTLYNQQYVYVKAEANWSPGFTNKITIYTVTGSQYDLDTAQVFELPDGSYIVVGTIKSDATRYLPATSAYGVVKVGLSGNSTVVVDIPEARRPDFYLGQTLTVCVMLTKS